MKTTLRTTACAVIMLVLSLMGGINASEADAVPRPEDGEITWRELPGGVRSEDGDPIYYPHGGNVNDGAWVCNDLYGNFAWSSQNVHPDDIEKAKRLAEELRKPSDNSHRQTFTGPKKASDLCKAGLNAYGDSLVKRAADTVTEEARDDYAKEAKESAAKGMVSMFSLVTNMWTADTFNPTVADVEGMEVADIPDDPTSNPVLRCEAPLGTSDTAAGVGDQCYRPWRPIADMGDTLHPVMVAVLVLSMLVGCLRVAITQRPDGLADIGKGLAITVMVSGMMAIVVQALLSMTDGIAREIMAQAPDSDDAGLQNAAALLSPGGEVGPMDAVSFFVIVVVALLVVCAAVAQVGLMIFRMALIPVMVAFAPVAAASSSTKMGSQWLGKIMMWILAFVIYKPVAAATWVMGLRMLSDAASPEALAAEESTKVIVNVIAASVVLMLCIVALPALLKLLVPIAGSGMSSIFSGAAVAGVTAAGAMAVGSMAAGVGGAGLAASGEPTTGKRPGGGSSDGSSGGSGDGSPDGAVQTPDAAGAGGHEGEGGSSLAVGAGEGQQAPALESGTGTGADSGAGGADSGGPGDDAGSGGAVEPVSDPGSGEVDEGTAVVESGAGDSPESSGAGDSAESAAEGATGGAAEGATGGAAEGAGSGEVVLSGESESADVTVQRPPAGAGGSADAGPTPSSGSGDGDVTVHRSQMPTGSSGGAVPPAESAGGDGQGAASRSAGRGARRWQASNRGAVEIARGAADAPERALNEGE